MKSQFQRTSIERRNTHSFLDNKYDIFIFDVLRLRIWQNRTLFIGMSIQVESNIIKYVFSSNIYKINQSDQWFRDMVLKLDALQPHTVCFCMDDSTYPPKHMD